MGETSPGTARRVLAGGVLASMVAALVYAARMPETRPPAALEATEQGSSAAAPADAVSPRRETAAPVGAPVPAPEGNAEPRRETAASAAEPAPPVAEAKPAAPGFDLVRVEPDGSAVVAGRAEPGASVTIRADEEQLATTEADAAGNFVAIFRATPSEVPRTLTLESESDAGDTAASEEVVVLLPNASDAPSGPESTADATPAAGDEPPEVAATAIVSPEGVEATPTAPDPDLGARPVALASISYAQAGEVTLAGLGTAGAVLRAYVDDTLAREVSVATDGRWSMELGDVAAGIYTLRIDQLGPDGRVASRVETPFQRDYPRAPPPRPGQPAAGSFSVTVQPGHNLWTLARTHYGSGVLYTQIFIANRELIRDPDLIYPGQIFALPGVETAP